uniref:Zinc binding protein n=1 Tax=Siphoviridae sp. ctR5S1 TaxID=2825498 RepID=A0A8S5Q0Q6_9CAUD|nr:MAG TPA: zinc binding protein [Siphoviridae sp. ctR5S1]
MMDTCVCCGRAVPDGRMVCPGCERKTEERCGQVESWGEKLVELEERAKSNSHRISDLEADNKALHQLATSVEVLATKQEAIEENVNEIKADVKSIKALPGSRWEAVVKGVITAILAGLIGFALAKLGLG